jgi:hypothetical protein
VLLASRSLGEMKMAGYKIENYNDLCDEKGFQF